MISRARIEHARVPDSIEHASSTTSTPQAQIIEHATSTPCTFALRARLRASLDKARTYVLPVFAGDLHRSDAPLEKGYVRYTVTGVGRSPLPQWFARTATGQAGAQ